MRLNNVCRWYKIFVRKLEGKILIGTPRCRREDYIVARTWRLYKTGLDWQLGLLDHTQLQRTHYSRPSHKATLHSLQWQRLLNLCSTALSPLGWVSTVQGSGPPADPFTVSGLSTQCLLPLKTDFFSEDSSAPTNCIPQLTRKSKSHYDRRPVGQCVLVSSPVWSSWPDVNYCLTVTVLSISGAPSDERSGLSFVLVT
jgi:hypothetical protein